MKQELNQKQGPAPNLHQLMVEKIVLEILLPLRLVMMVHVIHFKKERNLNKYYNRAFIKVQSTECGPPGQPGHLAQLLVMMGLKQRPEPVPILLLHMVEISVLEAQLNPPAVTMQYVILIINQLK